jgi:hypothetical protein
MPETTRTSSCQTAEQEIASTRFFVVVLFVLIIGGFIWLSA